MRQSLACKRTLHALALNQSHTQGNVRTALQLSVPIMQALFCCIRVLLGGPVPGASSCPARATQGLPRLGPLTLQSHCVCAKVSCCWVAGYVQRDYSVGVLLKDLGKVLTVSYAHNIDPTSSVGAEVTKKLEEKEATVFALGYARHQAVSWAWAFDKGSLLSCCEGLPAVLVAEHLLCRPEGEPVTCCSHI